MPFKFNLLRALNIDSLEPKQIRYEFDKGVVAKPYDGPFGAFEDIWINNSNTLVVMVDSPPDSGIDYWLPWEVDDEN